MEKNNRGYKRINFFQTKEFILFGDLLRVLCNQTPLSIKKNSTPMYPFAAYERIVAISGDT